MDVFLTGASGYIGGSIAVALIAGGHKVTGLVRSEASARKVEAFGIQPLLGTLDDTTLLTAAARASDLVVNAASADHSKAVETLLEALENTGNTFIHKSGSSIVGTQSGGERVDDIFDEFTPIKPSPGRAARVALNDLILSYASKGLRPIIICPSLVYGLGRGPEHHSMQVPWLIALAKKSGGAKHYGPGENIWSNVHIDDLVDLYLLSAKSAPAGAFYFAENGENSMRQICEAINRMFGIKRQTVSMSLAEAAGEWGEGATQNTMGSNSRVRAVRARDELGWKPRQLSLIDWIATAL